MRSTASSRKRKVYTGNISSARMFPIPRSSGALSLRCSASLPNSNLHFRLSLPPISLRFWKKRWMSFVLQQLVHHLRYFRTLIAALIHLRFALRLWLNKQSRLLPRSAVSWILLPTFLVKDCLDILLPFLTLMCNASIQEGILPASQKEAIVIPALKKSGLDTDDMKNYRPISNLSFMSKVVEKLIFEQLSVYLAENNLFPKLQSGFRRFHSTESAVLRVLSDIYSVIDRGDVALLALLDVSAAFDTVDHSYPPGETVYIFRSGRTSLLVVRLVHFWPISIRAVGGHFITQDISLFWNSSRIGTRACPLCPLYCRCCQVC